MHVEAGLRTNNRYDPFPEEINRRLTSQLRSLHLAPTATSRANLLARGHRPGERRGHGQHRDRRAASTWWRADRPWRTPPWRCSTAAAVVLVTSHRRESWGEPMARTAGAVARLAKEFEDVTFVVPAHLNPVVREVLLPPLEGLANVTITDPLSYGDFARAMDACTLVLTDSGGVQEEAPSLGKPVLVLRETTERPEAVDRRNRPSGRH